MYSKQRVASAFILSLILHGCSGHKGTIGNLQYVEKKEAAPVKVERKSRTEVKEEYQKIVKTLENGKEKEGIERRIAEVDMIESIRKQLDSRDSEQKHYADAIQGYKDLLQKYPNSPNNADIIYQLAKAYDLEGEKEKSLEMLEKLTGDYPSYPKNMEAHFRIGDIYFNKGDFRRAKMHYEIPSKLGDLTLSLYAHYMLGWADYKEYQYVDSVKHFSYVLDSLEAKQLNAGQKKLGEDAIKAIGLALSNIGGAAEIEKISFLRGKTYTWRLYDDLGEFYLEKRRFEDAAKVYSAFVTSHPTHDKAFGFRVKLIETYMKGGFPHRALSAKEDFVDLFAVDLKKVTFKEEEKQEIRKKLVQFIPELASFYHAKGQDQQKALKSKTLQKEGDKGGKVTHKDMVSSFKKASDFYKLFMDLYPTDERIAEMTYLRAEANYSAGRFELAIADYERYAYDLNSTNKIDQKRASEAAYAAIIAHRKGAESKGKRSGQSFDRSAVDRKLKFAKHFKSDKRTPKILINVAGDLLKQEVFDEAYSAANSVVNLGEAAGRTLRKEAYGIMAYSRFQQARYPEAVDAYVNQRNLLMQPEKGKRQNKASRSKTDKKIAEITDQIAVALYKQSEHLMQKKQHAEAITYLLKIKALAPNSNTRYIGQFDAANLLIGEKRWEEAIVELHELEKLYPKREKHLEVIRNLGFLYEKISHWKESARYNEILSKIEIDSERRRESLYRSAEHYTKSKDQPKSIQMYKAYWKQYKKPLNVRMEVMYRLATIYKERGDTKSLHVWLKRMIDTGAKIADLEDKRSRWLAAWANMSYGDHLAANFKRKRLGLPLAESIQAKNGYMQQAVERYQLGAKFGILEFTTMSSFKIADLYETFAKELRASPKPKGLSKIELQMYGEILNEQAAPFDQLALDLHLGNIKRAWDGMEGEWINRSFISMRSLDTVRFNKQDIEASYGEEIK